MTILRETPLHSRTAPLCVSHAWRRWAGYLVASSYELSHEREYHAIRNAAALLDISPLFKYVIEGKDAARLLDRVVTRDVMSIKPGRVAYTTWCDSAGKVIDDGTVARLDESRYRLTSADPSYRWLHENAFGMDARITDVSDSTAALALQGPLSRTVLQQAANADLAQLKYFGLTTGTIAGAPVTLSRTGYTGDLGYEVWCDAGNAVAVWDAIMRVGEAYQVAPAGMLALDMARIEAGLMLLEVDYVSAHRAMIESQKSSPYELGLGWTVALDKPYFNGCDALRAESRRLPEWKFTGITVDWESLEALYAAMGLPPRVPGTAWRVSVPLYADGQQVGYASSGSWSPLLKKYITLAHLRASHAAPGTKLEMEVTVEHHRKRANARVTELPFFNPPRKRA